MTHNPIPALVSPSADDRETSSICSKLRQVLAPRYLATIVALLFPAIAVSTAKGEAWHISGLGYVDGSSSPNTQPTGISADGSTIVGYEQVGTTYQAFRWTAQGGMAGLGFLPGDGGTFATGVSADGNTVVGYGSQAFRWTPGGGMVSLGAPTYSNVGQGVAISPDGDTILVQVPNAHLYTWNTVTGYSAPLQIGGDTVLHGAAVANSASAVVGTDWSSGPGMIHSGQGFYLAQNGGIFFGVQSFVWAASPDCSIVVGGGDSSSEAFRWTAAEGIQPLGNLPGGYQSIAWGVSADGTLIVGRATDSALNVLPVVWDHGNGPIPLTPFLLQHGVTGLDGWTLSSVTAISADGRTITGTGVGADGYPQAWVATLVPEPSTWILLALGGALACAARRRCRPGSMVHYPSTGQVSNHCRP